MSRHKAKQTYSKRRKEVDDSETYIQHNRKKYAFAKVTLSSYDKSY